MTAPASLAGGKVGHPAVEGQGFGGGAPDGLGTLLRNSTASVDAGSKPPKSHWYSRRERRAACKEGKNAIYLMGLDEEHKRAKLIGFPCKQRTCQRCRKARRQKLYNKIKAAYRDNEGVGLFLTLTLDPAPWDEKLTAWGQFSSMWSEFILKLRRKFPGLLKGKHYAWVLEPHKSGWPHLHAILFGVKFVPVREMQAIWEKCGGGNLDVEKPKNEAAAYLTDYVTKQGAIDDELADELSDMRVRWFNMTHSVICTAKTGEHEYEWQVIQAWATQGGCKSLREDGWTVEVFSMDLDGFGRCQL